MKIEESIQKLTTLLDQIENDDPSDETIEANLNNANELFSKTQENIDNFEALLEDLAN